MRILVVEDELKMAGLLKRGLEEEGYAVDVAATGSDAVWAATENPYDAILLDVMLPDVNGFEVCRRLRAGGRWAPVLMLTARTAVTDRVAGRALTRRRATKRPAQLAVGDLTLDPATRQVTRAGTVVKLSPKGFSLLELFMGRPGEALTRAFLLERAWDFAYDGDSNVVDVYVRYLREKIDRPFRRNSIETVRGSGYRLREVPRGTADPR